MIPLIVHGLTCLVLVVVAVQWAIRRPRELGDHRFLFPFIVATGFSGLILTVIYALDFYYLWFGGPVPLVMKPELLGLFPWQVAVIAAGLPAIGIIPAVGRRLRLMSVISVLAWIVTMMVAGVLIAFPRVPPLDPFQLEVDFLRDEDAFLVTLKNRSGKTFLAEIEAADFHGSIIFTDESGKEADLMAESYANLLMTSVWSDPRVLMRPDSEFEWRLPRAQLDDNYGNGIALDDLEGGTIRAQSGCIVPVIMDGSVDGPTSTTVRIPRSGEK